LQTYSDPTSGNGESASSGSTTDQAKEKAKQGAQQAAGQAKSTVRTQVDQRSTEAGERVGGFASDVRSVGEQLREQGKDQPAKLAEQAADRAERLGDYLKGSDADRILGDIEDFGRRQPWAVIAGGVALGLVASRFLKASSSSRYEQRSRSQSSQSYAQLPARTYDTPTTRSGYSDPITGTTAPTTPPAYETTSGFEGSR
jgi:gas vesicle protein